MLFRVGLLVVASMGLGACGSTNVDARVQQYREAEAHDLIGKYNQAKMRGDALAMCVNSHQVAAAYQDAHDSGNAEVWTTVGAGDCRRARNVLAPDFGPPEPEPSTAPDQPQSKIAAYPPGRVDKKQIP